MNSTQYKNEFLKEHYDRINLTVAKGEKAIIENYAKSNGYKSLNAYINALIKNDMKETT